MKWLLCFGMIIWPTAVLALCPPPQWSYPYRGKLTVVRSDAAVHRHCGAPPFGARVVGCSLIGRGRCTVVLGTFETPCALQHEIAHCNGWPRDHR